MAIEETRKKIHFVPFEIRKGREVDDSPPPTLTLKQGSLRFNKSLISELSLNGKFVKFYYDPIKKVVGFQVKAEVNLTVVNKMWKMVKQSSAGGWTVEIGKMLDVMDKNASSRSYYQLPVKKYIESSDVMDKGQVFYFVELVDEVDKDGKIKEQTPTT